MKGKKLYIIIAAVLVVAALAVVAAMVFRPKSAPAELELTTEDGAMLYDDSGDELFCDYLDHNDWKQDTFFAEMVDAYNAFTILNGILSVEDLWMRYGADSEPLENLEYANLDVVRDEEVKALLAQCLDRCRNFYTLASDPDIVDSATFVDFDRSLDNTRKTMTERYYVDKYVDITEDLYWEALDNSSYVSETVGKFKCEKITADNADTKEAKHDIRMLEKKVKHEKDFNKRCALAMSYVYHVGFYRTDFSLIEPLLDDGRYSHQLFFLWRIWRCGIQLCNPDCGPSTWSQLPNKLYNEKRRSIAVAALNHIAEHRDDAVAVNQYLMTAAHPNMMRCGQFPLGNESFTEVYYLGLAELGDDISDSDEYEEAI